MKNSRGWRNLTKEERSAEMKRRYLVRLQKKNPNQQHQNGFLSFFDDPSRALQEIDGKVLAEQEIIKDGETSIAISNKKIERLEKLRQILSE